MPRVCLEVTNGSGLMGLYRSGSKRGIGAAKTDQLLHYTSTKTASEGEQTLFDKSKRRVVERSLLIGRKINLCNSCAYPVSNQVRVLAYLHTPSHLHQSAAFD